MAARRQITAALCTAISVAILPPVLPAAAQAPPMNNQVEKSPDAVNLSMEQRHIIKEIIIKDMKIEPQSQAAKVPTKVGDSVPSGIPLQPMPVEVTAKIPQLKTHSFVVKDDKVVIIDPRDNKVAALVD